MWGYEDFSRGPNKSFGKTCDFMWQDKRILFAEACGLNRDENPGCHVNLSLYYERNFAGCESFLSFADALEFVESKGTNTSRTMKFVD
jgi:hypothetical protein